MNYILIGAGVYLFIKRPLIGVGLLGAYYYFTNKDKVKNIYEQVKLSQARDVTPGASPSVYSESFKQGYENIKPFFDSYGQERIANFINNWG